MAEKTVLVSDDPQWYKDAIIYEVHIKSFHDSNNDGIGDFKGLLQKLDYLEGLGVTALWMLPFYPSPLKDDGYDISDYYGIHPNFGTLADFKRLIKAAHERGLRIITEMVINHTSSEHSWFKRARKAKPGSLQRDYYVWSDNPELYKETRIIFQDYENSNWTWDPVAGAYYWHRFYYHQPDLNFDNPKVHEEIFKAMDFWLDMGVDAMRLDAIPYLYERDGTNCENLPETHGFLKKLRTHVDGKYENRMLLAEANQWPEDAIEYFGDGDECHMAFHFPVMPRLFMSLNLEDRFSIIDIMQQTPMPPEGCQWAMFLRNHDELTLEMVTDEERDYMYRTYARDPRSRVNLGIRRRLAPLLFNDRRKIELMNVLLFSLPGTPVIYYGDEIGMGDNYYLGDRDGVRTPMQWSPDRNAGFSRTHPHQLYLPVIIDPEYHYEALNVENQERNMSSLLWFLKRLIAQRKYYSCLSRGTLEFLYPDNPKILAFFRKYKSETMLIVANLSRSDEVAEIDLSEYAGYIPEEVFSHNSFPVIRESQYLLTLAPYAKLWLLLEKEEEAAALSKAEEFDLSVRTRWEKVLEGDVRKTLENRVLPAFCARSRWFGGKARKIRRTKIEEAVSITSGGEGRLLIIRVEYIDGGSENYLLPVSFGREEWGEHLVEEFPQAVIARLKVDKTGGILYDGMYDESFRAGLLSLISQKKHVKGAAGELWGVRGKQAAKQLKAKAEIRSKVLQAEQSNSSALYDDLFFLKLYRRVEEGMNPDPEIVRYLTEEAGFPSVPFYVGSIEYRKPGSEKQVLSLLQEYVQTQGDAWALTQTSLNQFLERCISEPEKTEEFRRKAPSSVYGVDPEKVPETVRDLINDVYIQQMRLLGQRTGEMHLAFMRGEDNPDFSPEPFSKLYQRSLYQNLRGAAGKGKLALEKRRTAIPEQYRAQAEEVLSQWDRIMNTYWKITRHKLTGLKIRIHGDYHLGQVLFNGKDFLIIDFEGEPLRALSERRLKYSALRDVAGMVRSFHYAVYSALFRHTSVRTEDAALLDPVAEPWYTCVAGNYLAEYLKTVNGSGLLPDEEEHIEELLNAFIINKAVYEIQYELGSRPGWIGIPLRGIMSILEGAGK